jgi:hypothetical protein
LRLEDLNRDERKIRTVLRSTAGPLTIRELAHHAFKLRPSAYAANYRTRNALRRLVREGVVEQLARGVYQACAT